MPSPELRGSYQYPVVSSLHALIYFRDEARHVRDLGSENGTWVYNDDPKRDYIQEMVIDEQLEVVFGYVVARLTVRKESLECKHKKKTASPRL